MSVWPENVAVPDGYCTSLQPAAAPARSLRCCRFGVNLSQKSAVTSFLCAPAAPHPLHGLQRRDAAGIFCRLCAQHPTSGPGQQGHLFICLTACRRTSTRDAAKIIANFTWIWQFFICSGGVLLHLIPTFSNTSNVWLSVKKDTASLLCFSYQNESKTVLNTLVH